MDKLTNRVAVVTNASKVSAQAHWQRQGTQPSPPAYKRFHFAQTPRSIRSGNNFYDSDRPSPDALEPVCWSRESIARTQKGQRNRSLFRHVISQR